MADENVTPQAENSQENARRTLKLRPATTNPAGTPLADPMHGETDTSNLDVLDDTQTRKTIKIKPLNPVAPQVNIGGLPKTSGATPLAGTQTRKTVVLKPQGVQSITPAGDGETQTRKAVVLSPQSGASPISGTQTRKTVVLSPQSAPQGATPISGTQTRKTVVLSPQSAPQGATPISGTQTRKTVVLKPVASKPVAETPVAAAAPAAEPVPDTAPVAVVPETPAVAPADNSDETVTRKATVIADDDQTVKITRPKFSKPVMADPNKTIKLNSLSKPATKAAPAPAAPAAAPAAPEAPAVDQDQKEVPMSSKPTEVLPPTQELKTDTADIAANIPPPPPAVITGDINDFPTDISKVSGNKPSVFYTVIAAISLILIIASAAITLTQYLDYNHKIDVYNFVPGLPHANK